MPRLERVSRLAQIPGIGVDRMGNAADAACDPQMLRLENMDTDLLPHQAGIEATLLAVPRDVNNSYLPFWGQDAVRQAVAAHISRMSGIDYDWRTQCVISAGGCSGILNTLLATLEPGDEVITTDPIYAGLINRIRLAGGVTKFVPLVASPKGWRMDLQALAAIASDRTRMVLIANPSMPTGHVLTMEEWVAVAEVCKKTDAWLLYDAALERILFDGRKVIHPASLPGMAERTITVGAASKELRMIGWRVGWVVGPLSIMSSIGLVGITNVVCQVGIGMGGVAAALALGDDDVAVATKIWQERRDMMLNELRDLPIVPAHGGWSMLLDTVAMGVQPVEASQLLFQQAKIAATPMTGWGPQAERYIRFVFANEPVARLVGMGSKVLRALK